MFFGNSAEFWLGIQNSYDLEELQVNKSKFEHINKYVAA
jgi:plasmid maintenance system antidote protein VapI